MASALQKLLRKSPLEATRIITSINASQVPLLKPFESQPLPFHRFPPIEVRGPIHPSSETEHLSASSVSTMIFPSFPFGFSLNPIPANESQSPGVSDGDGGGDDSGELWADSVKKKRKRKMNKHKYKKLQKRMRRQS